MGDPREFQALASVLYSPSCCGHFWDRTSGWKICVSPSHFAFQIINKYLFWSMFMESCEIPGHWTQVQSYVHNIILSFQKQFWMSCLHINMAEHTWCHLAGYLSSKYTVGECGFPNQLLSYTKKSTKSLVKMHTNTDLAAHIVIRNQHTYSNLLLHFNSVSIFHKNINLNNQFMPTIILKNLPI